MRGMETRSPNHPNVVAVKRVIALEGDVVVTKPPYPFPREEVPVGHVWVEGDAENREKSLDSNYYGPVSLDPIAIKKQARGISGLIDRCRYRRA